MSMSKYASQLKKRSFLSVSQYRLLERIIEAGGRLLGESLDRNCRIVAASLLHYDPLAYWIQGDTNRRLDTWTLVITEEGRRRAMLVRDDKEPVLAKKRRMRLSELGG
jgi:hypothetical protein